MKVCDARSLTFWSLMLLLDRVDHVMGYISGSQTFLKKLRNGPLAIFLMAHGPLEKLTQINTKQHVDFL